MHDERLTLATICGGALQEKVDRALEKVAKNILDPNTEPGKKRTITLKITLKPNEADSEDVKVSAEVSYTLAPETGVATQFFVNKDLENDSVTVMWNTNAVKSGDSLISATSVFIRMERRMSGR